MRLTREELEMLDGRHGEAPRRAMDARVQLGTAYGAEDMVPIGYAHVHPGMALYARDVETAGGARGIIWITHHDIDMC